MPISGLSNQWRTYDALVDQFATLPEADAPEHVVTKHQMIRRLLAALHDATDDKIYVGTSHSQLNFNARDVAFEHDRTCPFAYVDVVRENSADAGYVFRTLTRKILGMRPTAEWVAHETHDIETVVHTIVAALPYAHIPVRRTERGG